MGIEYFPNYCLNNNDFSLGDPGTTIGVSFENDLEVVQNTECLKNRENTVSSKADSGNDSDGELIDNEDRNEIKESDSESEKKALINRQNCYTWGPPGGWVCFAGRY